MQELISVMEEIRDLLSDIKGFGTYHSITDLHDKLEEIKGSGLYDSIADLNDKLDGIKTELEELNLKVSDIESNVMSIQLSTI